MYKNMSTNKHVCARANHTQHNSEAGRSSREGLRAWPLHSRGTALAHEREGRDLDRTHLVGL